MDVRGMILGILWSIAMSPATMFVIWFIIVILEFCWRGLRNLIMIILFPGRLIHLGSHMLFAHLKGIKTRFIALMGVEKERSIIGIILSREHPLWVYAFCISPIFVAIPLYLLFLRLAIVFRAQEIFSIMFLWLAVSIFVEGMPSIEDLSTMLKMAIYYEPLSIIFLALTPIVFALNTYGFGMNIGIYITLSYVIAIMFLSLVCRRERVEVYGA